MKSTVLCITYSSGRCGSEPCRCHITASKLLKEKNHESSVDLGVQRRIRMSRVRISAEARFFRDHYTSLCCANIGKQPRKLSSRLMNLSITVVIK